MTDDYLVFDVKELNKKVWNYPLGGLNDSELCQCVCSLTSIIEAQQKQIEELTERITKLEQTRQS